MMKYMARSWEYVLSNYFPDQLNVLGGDLGGHLMAFRTRMALRPQLKKGASFGLVSRQVKILEDTLEDSDELLALLGTGQKEANRLLIPHVAEAMKSAYADILQEKGEELPRPISYIISRNLSGPGCYDRMKDIMSSHISMWRDTMFKGALQKVENALRDTLANLRSRVDNKVEDILSIISKNYSALLADQNIFKALATSREAIRLVLGEVDEQFQHVLLAPSRQTASVPDKIAEADAATVTVKEEELSGNGLGAPTGANVGAEKSAIPDRDGGVYMSNA
jgi:hypothetical protein